MAGDDHIRVGWLGPDPDHERGPVSTAFRDALRDLAVNHPAARTRGWHACPWCPDVYPVTIEHGGGALPIGDAEIHVAGPEGTFAAPTLVVHYVEEHEYRPPPAFVDAVLADPRLSRRR